MDKLYQFIYIDLIDSINLINFSGKKYFFTFIDNFTRMTKIYIEVKKSN